VARLGEAEAIGFVAKGLPKLAAAGWTLVGEDVAKRYKLVAGRATTSLRVTSGVDWFDVAAEVTVGHELGPGWAGALEVRVLAAAAGFLYAQKYPTLQQPAHSAWVLLGLKAFVAAVVGGIGNLRGAMAGGLLIAFIELFGAAYVSTQLRDVYVFGLLILVLLLRPEGLLGKATVEKV
jgi:hypothetical protein